MDDDLFDDDSYNDESDNEASLHRVARLSAARRAIANFVNILTNRNDLRVKYSSGKESYTTGTDIVISADDKPEHFDSMVGLALHEASHCLLTDFGFMQALAPIFNALDGYPGVDRHWAGVSIHDMMAIGRLQSVAGIPDNDLTVLRLILHPSVAKLLPTDMMKYSTDPVPATGNARMYTMVARQMLGDIKVIMNMLEDRRIDRWVYTRAGGYRPYYDSLYDRYFFTVENTKNLRWNPEWRELTVDNYINRMLLMFHPAAKSDALPGLDELYKLIDLKNIDRLTEDKKEWNQVVPLYENMPKLWKEANILYGIILKFAALARESAQEQGKGDGSMPGLPGMTAQDILDALNGNDSDLPNLDLGEPSARPVEDPDTTKSGKPKPSTFNAKRGNKQLEDIRKMTNGETKKKKAKSSEIQAADALEKAQADMVDLKGNGIPGGTCMVTRKMSDELFGEPWFPFGFRNYYDNEKASTAAVSAGKRMGAILVHRLQVRNDPVLTKQTRLQQGGLDRRLLAQLGMDNESVFQKSRVDTFKPAMLHLTLDGSGSMNGEKWNKVRTVATAMAYVGSKMRNVDTVISIRGGNSMPIVSVVFDSRRDRFEQFAKWINRLSANGSTPEGLCYAATMELITECASTHDVYFINFSDGEPMFGLDTRAFGETKGGRRRKFGHGGYQFNYAGEMALRHTKHMVQSIRESGIKILSYFISYDGGYYNSSASWEHFKYMYGQDAVKVNVQNVTDVLRTLNKLLLSRG